MVKTDIFKMEPLYRKGGGFVFEMDYDAIFEGQYF
jgi:hypothetical protein